MSKPLIESQSVEFASVVALIRDIALTKQSSTTGSTSGPQIVIKRLPSESPVLEVVGPKKN